MSFYSYLILVHILQRRQRLIFVGLFWTIIVALFTIRAVILTTRVRLNIDDRQDLQPFIDHLHVGYFTMIALIECLSAFFLLQKLAAALQQSVEAAARNIVIGPGSLEAHLLYYLYLQFPSRLPSLPQILLIHLHHLHHCLSDCHPENDWAVQQI
jgi:hypothetical protein